MGNVGHRLLALKGEEVSLKSHVFSADSCPLKDSALGHLRGIGLGK